MKLAASLVVAPADLPDPLAVRQSEGLAPNQLTNSVRNTKRRLQ